MKRFDKNKNQMLEKAELGNKWKTLSHLDKNTENMPVIFFAHGDEWMAVKK